MLWQLSRTSRTLLNITKRGYHEILKPPPHTLPYRFEEVPIDYFRENYFEPELPVLIKSGAKSTELAINCSLPAASKWFDKGDRGVVPSSYLSQYGDTILPYELITSRQISSMASKDISLVAEQWPWLESMDEFTQFNAPLSLLLQECASDAERDSKQRLYIAQAQLIDLPKELQADLSVPRLVTESGKGDIYDANLWMGIPPTDTPLHKDPNPNLFIQLAGCKRVRLLPPEQGEALFRTVQEKIGSSASSSMRGNEMMEGCERVALDHEVWGDLNGMHKKFEGFDALVGPGSAVFIPKGWWHSIKSIGLDEVVASVNWWFR